MLLLVTVLHALDRVELHRCLRADDGEHVFQRPRRLARIENEREVVRQRALAEARFPDRGRDVDADAALVADVDDVALQSEQRADLDGPHEIDLGDRARRRSAPARNAIDADRLAKMTPVRHPEKAYAVANANSSA